MSNIKYDILLGSASPRRRALLEGLDIPFTAITIDADESYPAELKAGDIPYYISRAKAQAYAPNLTENQLLITADTIVWLDDHMLGKPHDEAEAVAMLRQLRNKTHQVYTAVTFAEKKHELIANCQHNLTDDEIAYYVAKYRPFDKAGAYGIQEWIGYVACTSMRGSYFNVMGFPVHKVYEILKKRIKM